MMNVARSLVSVPMWELDVGDFLVVIDVPRLRGRRFMLLKFLTIYPIKVTGPPISGISWEMVDTLSGKIQKGTGDIMVSKVKGSKKEELAMLPYTC